jgi:hypothetical protein
MPDNRRGRKANEAQGVEGAEGNILEKLKFDGTIAVGSNLVKGAKKGGDVSSGILEGLGRFLGQNQGP